MENKIQFTDEDGEKIDFYVIEQTRISGKDYLLVTDSADDETEADAYIMKDISEEQDEESVYVLVDDDNELEYLSKVFEELLGDEDVLV